ncbi:MAG: phenylacetate--CoA ligase family protein [Propionibacteriaceae bacterium]
MKIQNFVDEAAEDRRYLPRLRELWTRSNPARGSSSERDCEKLAEALRAASRVPAYSRQLCDEISPTDAKAHLQSVPLVRRTDVASHWMEFVAPDVDPASTIVVSTSGSSGEPLDVLLDVDDWLQVGVNSMRRAALRGSPPWGRRLIHPVRDMTAWTSFVSPSDGNAQMAYFDLPLTAWSPAELTSALRQYRPHEFRGKATRALDLADVLIDKAKGLGLVAITTTGEQLLPKQRELLESAFDAPVIDAYGLTEVQTIAAQCVAGSYHIEEDRVYVEIIEEKSTSPVPPGSLGEIVVTGLLRHAMPLVRYATGDLGRILINHCPCGQPGHCLEIVHGRYGQYLACGDGSRLDFAHVAGAMKSLNVTAFQARQIRPGALVVYFDGEEDVAAVDAALRLELKDFSVEINRLTRSQFVKADGKTPPLIQGVEWI